MVADLRITGAEKFARVARELKAAGDKEMRRELAQGLGRATKPLKAAAKESARTTLPKRGGLAARVASSSFRTRTKTGSSPSIQITARESKSADLAGLDAGVNRHPVWGNRARWATQRVTPGWFTRPMVEGGGDVRTSILAAVDAVLAKLK
jgi:hypothetical protein